MTAPSARLYRWFTGIVLIALTLPRMTQRGMFGDGLIYATIARNLSVGFGSFWAPSLTLTRSPEFFDSPPLGFGLEAIAFRLLGDHLVVERFYSLVMFALTAWLIVRLWRRVMPVELDWLPLLLWILPSIVTWAAVNNMLENTQAVFTTAAVLMVVIAFQSGSTVGSAVWSIGAGLASVAAVLTKGPVGLFPLAAPVLWWLMPCGRAIDERGRPTRRALIVLASMAVTMLIGGLLLWTYEPSRHWATEYVRTQLVASLQGKREVNGDPFASVRHLGLGIIARMLVVAGIFHLVGRRGVEPGPWRVARWFFVLGWCASVPIAISPKLAGHYFLPSVSMFAIGVGGLMTRPASSLIGPGPGWHRRVPMVASALLVAATIVVIARVGSLERRDVGLLRDLDVLSPVMPPRGTLIGACRALPQDMDLHSYLQRLFEVSLDAEDAPVNGWLLQPDRVCPPPPGCTAAAGGERLVLFSCPR